MVMPWAAWCDSTVRSNLCGDALGEGLFWR
jgi:hypothetical protein